MCQSAQGGGIFAVVLTGDFFVISMSSFGRKDILVDALIKMGTSIAAIDCLPGYQSIEVIVSILVEIDR